jgi:hypothetical protein
VPMTLPTAIAGRATGRATDKLGLLFIAWPAPTQCKLPRIRSRRSPGAEQHPSRPARCRRRRRTSRLPDADSGAGRRGARTSA